MFCNTEFPQPVSIAIWANKVVAKCKCPKHPAFAQAFVIVRIASKGPEASLHKACIYTVPKHYPISAFASKEAYRTALGFQVDDKGKIERIKEYLSRLKCYMEWYGAIVQTDSNKMHGLKEGWAWLARFVNALPANIYTANALLAFLRMAGYASFRKYRNQFLKLLNTISDNFLKELKDNSVIVKNIKAYINDKVFHREPEGRQLKSDMPSLPSKE